MKKLMKKYGHVWILSYGLIYLPWFAALQQNVGKPYHVMHTALDGRIPVTEDGSGRCCGFCMWLLPLPIFSLPARTIITGCVPFYLQA